MSHRLINFVPIGGPGFAQGHKRADESWHDFCQNGLLPLQEYMHAHGFERRLMIHQASGWANGADMRWGDNAEAIRRGLLTGYGKAIAALPGETITYEGYWDIPGPFSLKTFLELTAESRQRTSLAIDSYGVKLGFAGSGYHEHLIHDILTHYEKKRLYAEGVAQSINNPTTPLIVATDDKRFHEVYRLRTQWKAEIILVLRPPNTGVEIAAELIARGFTVAAPVNAYFEAGEDLSPLLKASKRAR